MPDLTPTLPGYVNGIIGRDPWRIQCQDCALISEDDHLILALKRHGGMIFHHGWPDGTNPRLCRACRLARGCHCDACERERQNTEYPRRATR